MAAEHDQAAAFQLYRLAAEQGIAGAQCRLGVMFAEGRGVARDDQAAVKWFRLAAEQGDPEAQAGLGLAYGTAQGVPQDFVASYMWMTLAVGKLTGVARQSASRFRATIAAAMTSEQLAQAEGLVREWTSKSDP